MRLPVRCLEITSNEVAFSEMERIGVDPYGVRLMAPKQFHYNLKIDGLTPAQANILKQDMLSIGGEAAIARGAASCSVESTGALVSGTLKQLNALCDKLGRQSLGLPRIANAMKDAIGNRDKREYLVKGRDRDFSVGPGTLVMGILNVTPDSFSDGGRFLDPAAAVERGLEMAEDGAAWIDVGGESTRPGAEAVDADEELRRVVPVIGALAKEGLAVSIDTTKAAVAKAALEEGASIVNDVSALSFDSGMAGVVASYGAPLIMMHMRGTPKTMQLDTSYADLMSGIYSYLSERIEYAASTGIAADRIIVDPGLGFGKSAEGNFEILRRLRELKSLGCPVLAGPSRKAFIGKTLGVQNVEERLPGTIAACVAAVLHGASVIRVHDVKEAKKAVMLADAIIGNT